MSGVVRLLRGPLIVFHRSYTTHRNINNPPTPTPTPTVPVPRDNAVLLQWDGEGLNIRKTDNMKMVMKGLLKTIEKRGFPTDKVSFFLYGNAHKDRLPYLNDIIAAGFTHIPTEAKKQAADRKMKDELELYLNTHAPGYIVIVACDGGYKRKLDRARKKGFQTLVIGRGGEFGMAHKLKERHWVDWIALLDSKDMGVECNPPNPPTSPRPIGKKK